MTATLQELEPRTGRVLVVDDNGRARTSTADVLRLLGHEVHTCSGGQEALKLLKHEPVDVILTDLQMPGMDGLEFMRQLQQRRCDAQVVMINAFASISTAVEAMRIGAFDYLEKPFDADRLENVLRRALEHGVQRGRRVSMGAENSTAMISTSTETHALRQRIKQVAGTDETVLISGESGTGKELVARCLHAVSRRKDKPLVSLNCPALSPQLMESELFGHERGAFTSADAVRVGRFELAEGGTILLDEITEIELPLQAKLLRVLQERTLERVGSSQSKQVDVRVLATSNRDILQEVHQGRFRQDLYYRLAVVPIWVPPLRQRREDVPLLVDHFLRVSSARLGRGSCLLVASVRQLLQEYHWPGNVRELENVITRANVLFAERAVHADDIRSWLIDAEPNNEHTAAELIAHEVKWAGMKLDEMERRLIEATLDHYEGHRAKAADALGIGIRTLSNKLRLYGYSPRAKVFGKAA